MRVSKLFIYLLMCVVTGYGLFVPQYAFASFFFFDGPERVLPFQTFVISLNLDTDGELINALSGVISVSGTLALDAVYIGDSVVAFWAEAPDSDSTEVQFSGVIPGGYLGKSGVVLSINLKAGTQGIGEIIVKDVSILRSDGLGTESAEGGVSYSVTVMEDAPVLNSRYTQEEDILPPEQFEIFIEQNSDMFRGNFFAVFEAQDKGLGVDYYEVQERQRRHIDEESWKQGDSPYELLNQSLTSYIFVKAVDKAGNTRISVYTPQNIIQLRLLILYGIVLAMIFYYVVRRYSIIKRRKYDSGI